MKDVVTTSSFAPLGSVFAQQLSVKDFDFAAGSTPGLPRHNRASYAIVAALYVLLVAALVQLKTHPVRVGSAGSPFGSMTAYVSGPASAGPATPAAKPVEPKKTTIATRTAKAATADQTATGASAGSAGAGTGGQGSGPVRLGSGGSLSLIKKVTPIYPPIMQSARMAGQVVLDAIIHPDGTIGDIKVLQSTNDAFAQSAIAAVRQWQYAAPGYEGILTVTVNFTLPH
jgi:TonB family protein